MTEEPKAKTFVICRNEITRRIKKNLNIDNRGSYYFSQDSTAKLFNGLIGAGYLIERCSFDYQPGSVRILVCSEPLVESPYLESLVIEGFKRVSLEGCLATRNSFQLSLKNRRRNEEEIKHVGPYRDRINDYSWIEVAVEIKADEDTTIESIEKIVIESAVPALYKYKTEVDNKDEIIKEEFFGNGIKRKKEKEEKHFDKQKKIWIIKSFEWVGTRFRGKWQLKDVREQKDHSP